MNGNVVETVRAKRFELVDDSGKVRAVLGNIEDPTKIFFSGLTQGSGVIGLQLLDDSGEERVTLAITNNGDDAMLTLITRGMVGRLAPKENVVSIRAGGDTSDITLGTKDPQEDFPTDDLSLQRFHQTASSTGQNGQAGEQVFLHMGSDTTSSNNSNPVRIVKPAPADSVPVIELRNASGLVTFREPPFPPT